VATGADVVRIALGEVGYTEGPNNFNKYAAEVGHANNQPWCGTFTDAMLKRAGQTGEPSSVWTPSGLVAYRKAGRALDRNGPAQAGDIVYFDYGGSTDASKVDHVGIVVQPRLDGQVETVEGNTSPTNAGSQSAGGGVYRRVRPRSIIAGFGRPAYSGQSPTAPPPQPQPSQPTPEQIAAFRRYAAAILQRDLTKFNNVLRRGMSGPGVLALQRSLNVVAGRGLSEDGRFGPATEQAVRDFQRFLGLGVDGIVGPQTRGVLLMALGRIEKGQA